MNQQDYLFDYSDTLTANSDFYSIDINPNKYQPELTFDQQPHKTSLLETSYQELATDFCPFEDLLNNYYGDLMQMSASLDSSVYDFNVCQSVATSSMSPEVNVPSPSGTTNWPSCPSSPNNDRETFQSLIMPFSATQTPGTTSSNSSISSISSSNSSDFRPVLPSTNIDKTKAHRLPMYASHYPPSNKPFSCHVCPRSFARKHDLQRHIRVHTGAKPYSCLNCSKAFARTDALKRHLRMEDACRLSPVIQAMKDTGSRRYRNL